MVCACALMQSVFEEGAVAICWIPVWACSQIRLFISTTCSQPREHTVVSFVVENVKWQAVVGVEDRHIVFYQRSYVIALNQFI